MFYIFTIIYNLDVQTKANLFTNSSEYNEYKFSVKWFKTYFFLKNNK